MYHQPREEDGREKMQRIGATNTSFRFKYLYGINTEI